LLGQHEPAPLLAQGNLEAYLHLAGQGLMLESPSPIVEAPQPAPPPIIEVTRRPETGPRTVFDAMRYWLVQVLQTG
jgi:hypothetical protein